MRRNLHHFLHTYICRKRSCTCTCAGTLLHIYVCWNTSCTYIHVHGAGNVLAHHVQEFFLPITMFRNTIYMCRNTACTYRYAGILPANAYVQEYFLHTYACTWGRKISCTSCAGILPANKYVQEYFLHIYMCRDHYLHVYMCRNTTCTYRCAGILPAHVGVYTHV